MKKKKNEIKKEERAYGVVTPALGASSKGSEGEQSHACREMTPIAI